MPTLDFLSLVGVSAVLTALIALITVFILEFKATPTEKENYSLLKKTFAVVLILGNCLVISTKIESIQFLLYTSF